MFETVSYDISALAILMVLLFVWHMRRTAADKVSTKLVDLILVTSFVAVLDINANANNGMIDHVEINYICSGLYHILRNVTFYIYVRYIILIIGIQHKYPYRILNIAKYMPIVAMVLIAVSTPFTHFFYYYDDKNTYMRGEGFLFIYFLSFLYAVSAFYFIVRNMSIIGKRKALSLASCAIFSLGASVIQFSRPYIVIDIFGFALSILFIVLFIDNPADRIDNNSSLLNGQAYYNDLRTIFFTNRPVDIIHINNTNHRAIEEMLDYGSFYKLISDIGAGIQNITKGVEGCKAYRIRDGRFRIVLDGNSIDRTNNLANELLSYMNSEINVNDVAFSIESSICISQCPEDFNIFDDIIDFGEAAAQFEKAGKIVYSKDILKVEGYDFHAKVNKMIEKGLVDGNFEVYYQPICNVKTGGFEEVEAVLRLHESKKTWNQEEFLEEAEKNGSIIELGEFMMEEVCKFIASDEFKKSGLHRVSMRLSVIQCMEKDLQKYISELLEKYNITAENIGFNITESIASDNQKTFTENIEKLAQEGISLTIDEFGAGYSNIITLASMPIDAVKIDKSFAGGGQSEKVEIIFERTVQMIKSLGKAVVVDGVEGELYDGICRTLGCDYLQGDFYAKIMTKPELIDFYSGLNS